MNEKWEYLREQINDDAGLNALGEQGWELVAIEPIDPKAPNPFTTWGGTAKSVYVFKRRKQS